MILTKDELRDHIESITQDSFINCDRVYEAILESLDWCDEEPRDVNSSDIAVLEEILATEVDEILNSIESLVSH